MFKRNWFHQGTVTLMDKFLIIVVTMASGCQTMCREFQKTEDNAVSGSIVIDRNSQISNPLNCSWEIDTGDANDTVLFVFINKFEFLQGIHSVANFSFGQKRNIFHMRKQCILFMRNETTLDVSVITNHVKFATSSCQTWKIDLGYMPTVEIVTNNPTISNISFEMRYQYIPTHAGFSGHSSASDPFERPSEKCDRGVFAAAFAVTLVLFCITVILFTIMTILNHKRIKTLRMYGIMKNDISKEQQAQPGNNGRNITRSGDFTRFSRLQKKRGSTTNENFIHFTLSRQTEPPSSKNRAQTLPE